MGYFNQNDHNAVLAYQVGSPDGGLDVERTYQRMTSLQRRLTRNLKANGLPLFPNHAIPGGISQETVTTLAPQQVMTMMFTRSETDMKNIEVNMGHDDLNGHSQLESCRHPMIELRLSPEHFAVELVVAPDAWYDQQNFAGKLTLQEQRVALYELVRALRGNYFIGFWSGIYPQEMHLSTEQLPPAYLFNEFIGTFAAGRDYLRAGIWYEVGDPALNEDAIENEFTRRIKDLYTLYEYVRWTSNNNYHKFYRKLLTH